MSGGQVSSFHEPTPAHRLSAWATRGLASHTELPKMVGTIATYIVYDNVTQYFGHEPLFGAMRFSQEPNNWLHVIVHLDSAFVFRLKGHEWSIVVDRPFARVTYGSKGYEWE